MVFEGDAPTETQVTTLVEGEGEGIQSGDFVAANILVALWNSGVILQSSWEQGTPAQLAMQPGSLVEGLEQGIELPPDVAYPDGGGALEDGDALVFIIEPLRITN